MTRQEQKEETLRRILEVSLELFVKNGFHGTTTRDIAAAAGISPGLMFHYFPTKEALYAEILRGALGGVEWATGIGQKSETGGHMDDVEGTVLPAALNEAPSGGSTPRLPDCSGMPETHTAGEQILPIFRHIAENILSNCRGRTPAVFVLVKQAQTGNFATAEMKEIIGRMNAIEGLTPLISMGQRLGEIREGNPLALSACFFTAIQGIAENAYCYPDIPLPESEWLVDLLRAPAKPAAN